MLMLTFLRWFKKTRATSFDVLILRNGPLRGDFAALGTTYLADQVSGRGSAFGRLTNKLLKRSARHWVEAGSRKLLSNGYSTVYGNSIVCLPWLLEFKQNSDARCVCAVHELTLVINSFFEKPYVTASLERLDAVVAGSQIVADNLVANYAVSPSRITVVHAFIDKQITISKSKAELRQLLGIEPGELAIGGVGIPELRKGTDMLVPLAAALRRRFPELRFKLLWLGGHPREGMINVFKNDAEKLGLSRQVVWIESSPAANDYINLFDVFILPSREDPFPLVAVTAATLAKPIVAFEQGGGMVDLLRDGAGLLVPFLDIDKFADAIHEVASNAQFAAAMGKKVAERLKANFDSETESIALRAVIEGAP